MADYSPGEAARKVWERQLASLNAQIDKRGARVAWDDGFVSIDADLMGARFMDHYSRHAQIGAWNGWA